MNMENGPFIFLVTKQMKSICIQWVDKANGMD